MQYPVRALVAALLISLQISCGGFDSAADGRVVRIDRSYAEETGAIRNPERGMVQFVHMDNPSDVAYVAGLGVSLANVRVRLDPFRAGPITAAKLSYLTEGFERLRAAGLKAVVRFQYNIGSGKDPDLDQVLAHIDQLRPLLRANADVIAVLQAGFIGAWGEWHTSISGLTEPAARHRLLQHLLDALPAHRSIQVRSPAFKRDFAGGPTRQRDVDRGTDRARIGHHNDCLLSGETDHGTFRGPGDRDYLVADSPFVPVGGETCAPAPPRTDCTSAVAELRRFHYSYLNRSYHPEVLAGWSRQGCLAEIERDLGYRLVMRRASWPARARAGDTIRLELWLENLGYAAPFNDREAFLVVGNGRGLIPLPELDVRSLRPGGLHHLSMEVALPDGLPRGDQLLALWLPDSAPALRGEPAYSIRLANRDTWIERAGTNALGWIEIGP